MSELTVCKPAQERWPYGPVEKLLWAPDRRGISYARLRVGLAFGAQQSFHPLVCDVEQGGGNLGEVLGARLIQRHTIPGGVAQTIPLALDLRAIQPLYCDCTSHLPSAAQDSARQRRRQS